MLSDYEQRVMKIIFYSVYQFKLGQGYHPAIAGYIALNYIFDFFGLTKETINNFLEMIKAEIKNARQCRD